MRRHLDDHPSLSTNVYTSVPGSSSVANSLQSGLPRVESGDTHRVVTPSPVNSGTGTVTRPISPSVNIALQQHQTAANVVTPVSQLSRGTTGKLPVQRQPLAYIQDPSNIPKSENTAMQSGLQFSVQTGYQSRVGSSLVSPSSHSASSTPGHHPHSLPAQTPVHQQPQVVVHQTQAQTAQGQQQQQFQRLKVEDALSYLDQVKFRFGNQPQVYNDFLDIMKEFKSQSIDTPGVIQRVSNLFKGHPELIVGFNTFLPPGYKIEVHSNDQVNVTMPNSNSAPTSNPTGLSPANVPAPSNSSNQNSSSQANFPSHISQNSHTNTPSPVIGNKAMHQISVVSSQTHTSVNSQHPYHQSSPPHATNAPSAHSPSTPQASQPVEFNHAINYVNKIKNRFQGQPDIYKQFLEILHTYQKEQRNLKQGNHAGSKPLTESEVYAQVAKLFQNQEDLLQEFGQFLPDANGAASILQPTAKAVNNDHTAAAKKPVVSKPVSTPVNNQAKQPQAVKRPAPSLPSQPNKKQKMTSLKDVTLTEAGKHGTLNEFAFFDKVRKALRSQEAYENFLRCIVVYNNEVISRSELVHLVTPFLGKYNELFKWFKDFIGHKESGGAIDGINTKTVTQERERIGGDLAMEIDYSSCKKYGASYRALPKNYVQLKCSGRTPLCKEVLNDTWVSFPSWSEDSTFVSSRKTQYEEYIYRCEDERFELDIVLESNLSTIRVLEAVQKKMTRMTSEEKLHFRLDDTLGGTSTVIHQQAIKRIYGDKAGDIIEGLKKNPAIAVPLVLRRLKAKEEEWREAQRSFNKIWREQNEKYYLKSLDYQGINFKQNDMKFLRSKSLLNEIDTIFEEQHEQAEECSGEIPPGPQITLHYKDRTILEDAANLIIHHVKRQTGIHKEEKQKIKQLLRQFIPDFFCVPRGELSDDEIEKEDTDEKPTIVLPSCKNGVDIPGNCNKEIANKSTNITNSFHKEIIEKCTDNKERICLEKKERITHHQNSIPDDTYTLFFLNNNWYLYFRLHHILCERLTKMYERATVLVEEDQKEKKDRKESVAVTLRLKPKSEIDAEEYYTVFLDMVKNLLDGNMDSNQYEDTLRELFGIHAYIAFTLDKVVQYTVRQLQHIVSDENCIRCTELYLEQQKTGTTGGPCSTAIQRTSAENSYQKKAEQILSEENCFKVILYKTEGKLTIELLDTDTDATEHNTVVGKWREYIENHVHNENVSDRIKDHLLRKPVFLPRNIQCWKRETKHHVERGTNDGHSETNADNKAENRSEAAERLSSMELGQTNIPSETNTDIKRCKFIVNSCKMIFVIDSNSYLLYKYLSMKNAHQLHQYVSLKLNEKFHSWHRTWLDRHVTPDQHKTCEDWLMGSDRIHTIRIKEDNPTKPPYSPYHRYKLDHQSKT